MNNLYEKLSRPTNIVLVGILLVAASVRYWAIDFGLPQTDCRPDEVFIVAEGLSALLNKFRPDTYDYGSLYKYIASLSYVLYSFYGFLTQKFLSLQDFFVEYRLSPTYFYLIIRCITAFLGTATVLIVYKIAKHLFDRRTALTAALFLSLTYLHVRDSHFATVDVPMTFFIMWSFLYIVKAYNTKNARQYLLAGVLAGLATSVKYAGVMLFIPMFVVHVLNSFEQKQKSSKLLFDKRILLFTCSLIFSFLVTMPYAVIDFFQFAYAVFAQFIHVAKGHVVVAERGWLFHSKVSLFYGMGWPMLLSAILGFVYLLKNDFKKTIIVAAFPLIYFSIAGSGYTTFIRYIIPIVPFLCIFAGYFVTTIINRFLPNMEDNKKKLVLAFAAILVLILPATNIMLFNDLLSQKDSRLLAREWIEKNVPYRSSIYQETSFWGRVVLPVTVEMLEMLYDDFRKKGISAAALKAELKYRKQNNIKGYDQWLYRDNTYTFYAFDPMKEYLPEFIIVETSPLKEYSKIPDEIKQLVGSSYELKKTFFSVDVSSKKNVYDQQDAFYVPFSGFDGVVRPGPNLLIFKRK